MVPQITPLSHGVSRVESHGHETGPVSRSHGGIPLKGDIHPHETTEPEDRSPLYQSQGHRETKSGLKIINPVLPTVDQLDSDIEKLLANPGSVILIAIQANPETQNYFEVGWSWFNHDDRNAIKRAVDRARSKRKDEARKASDAPSNTNIAEDGADTQEEQP